MVRKGNWWPDWFCLVWFYRISTIIGYLMPNPIYSYILDIYDLLTHQKNLMVPVKWSHSSIPNNSFNHKSFVCSQFKCQTVLFEPSVLPLQARVDLGAMTGVLYIPQSSGITGALPSDCLVFYPGHSLWGVLLHCTDAVGEFYSTSQLGCMNKYIQ